MSRIYVVADDGELLEMRESAYPSEDHLQELLARYPGLLPGYEMNPEIPLRWLLVAREAGVPDQSDGSDRWSLDLLVLDQYGVPTLVEVKRSTDSRLRREVVGQMLDYAANGIVYWPVERLQALFVRTCELAGVEPDLTLAEFLSDGSPDAFWKAVKTNLQAGRVRLVFVADEVPSELSRIVEFLNTQMDPAEVLAVEIPRFSGSGLQTLVPRLIGQTVEARTRKAGSSDGVPWDEPRFLTALEENGGPPNVACQLMRWSERRGLRSWWGRGTKDGSFIPVLDHKTGWYSPFALWTYGAIELQFQYLKQRGPFASVESRERVRERLNAIPGVDVPVDRLDKRPSFPMKLLEPRESLAQFKATVDWMIDQVRSGNWSD